MNTQTADRDTTPAGITGAENLDHDADAVLVAFVGELERGAASVADWSGRHPRLGRDFARLAAQNFAGGDTAPENDPLTAERLGRIARNTLLRYKAAYLGADALTALIDKERGITAARLSEATRLPVPFIAKLNQRLFTLASLPPALIGRLAETVGRTADEVAAFLAGPPMLARNAAYRSDDAPTVAAQEDFVAALRADGSVTAEARAIYGGG